MWTARLPVGGLLLPGRPVEVAYAKTIVATDHRKGHRTDALDYPLILEHDPVFYWPGDESHASVLALFDLRRGGPRKSDRVLRWFQTSRWRNRNHEKAAEVFG